MAIWMKDKNQSPLQSKEVPTEDRQRRFREHILKQLRVEGSSKELDSYISNTRVALHKNFHSSTKRWIMEHRLQIARTLLLSTEMSIEQICTYCHLPKPTHFIVHFRHYYNISPIKLRELHRK